MGASTRRRTFLPARRLSKTTSATGRRLWLLTCVSAVPLESDPSWQIPTGVRTTADLREVDLQEVVAEAAEVVQVADPAVDSALADLAGAEDALQGWAGQRTPASARSPSVRRR